tara:strand:+ start:1358 stop:1705 length:348 start_codon:yes stop_codon:yes gene_type:complete
MNTVTTVYTVTEFDEIDCYKRAETFTTILGTFRNVEDAQARLAAAYVERYLEDGLHEHDAHEPAGQQWHEMHANGNTPEASEIISFFERHADGLWEPHYIDETIYRVEITRSELL